MTTISISAFIKKVRLAVDELMHVTDDDFYTDFEDEIKQCLGMAIRQLSLELPANMLIPTVLTAEYPDLTPAQRKMTDGSGWVVLPDDYLRLIEFKLKTWMQAVHETLDPVSDEAKRQASLWSRGTPQKPRAMEAWDSEGNHILKYWTAGRYTDYQGEMSNVYDHTIETLQYMPSVDMSNAYAEESEEEEDLLDIPLKDSATDFLVYRAASLLMTAKKETALAQQFWQLSQAMTPQAVAETEG